MTEAAESFHELMGQLDYPMAVVTTAIEGRRAGCLVGFHTQCSIDPPRIAVWLSKANHTYRVGLMATTFALHLLDRSDSATAELFGTLSGDDIDKFDRCPWDEGPDGVPLLRETHHRLLCRRVSMWDDGGDHVCIVLEPVETRSDGPLHPLTFQQVRHLDPGHEAEERQRP